MRLITVQHRTVLEQLLNNKRYIADINRVPENRVKPYQYMQKFYNWEHCPVFCCLIGTRYSSGFGFNLDNAVILELEVPENIVKLQYFYDWSDVIYFMEFPKEFPEVFDTKLNPTIENFADRVLRCENQGSYDIFQATIPYINPDWLVRYLFTEKYIQVYLNQIEKDRIIHHL